MIEGYLLGHTAFVSSIDTVRMKDDNRLLCISCGGDSTLRLWDITPTKENTNTNYDNNLLYTLQFDEMIPTKVVSIKNTNYVAVLFDESNVIHLYYIINTSNTDEKEEYSLKLQQSWTTTTTNNNGNTLGMALWKEKDDDEFFSLAVLTNNASSVLQIYKPEQENTELSFQPDTNNTIALAVQQQLEGENLQSLPSSRMEMDEHGNVKYSKFSENRRPNRTMPWHRINRVERVKNGRRKRNKRIYHA